MPFKKGQGGRPPGAANRLTANAKQIFLTLGGLNGKAYAQQLHNLAVSPETDPHARLKALAIIAPYVWGKPTEYVEMSGPSGGAVQIHHHFAE